MTDEDVDWIFTRRRLQAISPQRLHQIGRGERPVVGANQDARNGHLNASRLGLRVQANHFLEALAIGQTMAREHEGWILELFAGLDAAAVQQLYAQLGRLRVQLVKNEHAAEANPS